jgi:hypothetical protein
MLSKPCILKDLTGLGKKKKKTPIIVLKKTAPKKKHFQTGKLKVVPTSQAEKIAKAVASLIPRPKGKKKSTIETRMIKLKKQSIKKTPEELTLLRLGKEEALFEKEELKKPRKARADKGTHRPKWYYDRGLPVPEPLFPPRRVVAVESEEKESKDKEKGSKTGRPIKDRPAPPPKTEIIVEPAKAPVHIIVEKKPEPSFNRSKSREKETERLKKIPPTSEKPKEKPPAVPFKPPITGILASLAKPPAKATVKPTAKPSTKLPAGDTKKIKVAPPSSESDVADSESESSVYSPSDVQTAPPSIGRGKATMVIAPPKKNRSSRSQVGV